MDEKNDEVSALRYEQEVGRKGNLKDSKRKQCLKDVFDVFHRKKWAKTNKGFCFACI